MTYDSWKLSNGYVASANEDLIAAGKDLVARWTEYLVSLDEDDDQKMMDLRSRLVNDTSIFVFDVSFIGDENLEQLEKEVTDLMSEALD